MAAKLLHLIQCYEMRIVTELRKIYKYFK